MNWCKLGFHKWGIIQKNIFADYRKCERCGKRDIVIKYRNANVNLDWINTGGNIYPPRPKAPPPPPGKDNRNRDNSHKRGRGTKKMPVVGIIDRNKKKIYARVALPNKDGKKLTGMQLLSILNEVCKQDSTIITDEFSGYNILRKTNHVRLTIDHSKEFAHGMIHTNNVESFWATLKRGVYGIYHHVSIKYLQNYVNEFCFRYNNRDNNMFDMVLKQSIQF